MFKIFSKEKKQSLDEGLSKTRESFFSKVTKAVIGKSKVDDEVLDKLEEILLSADIGVNTTLKIIDRLQQRVAKDKFVTTAELNKLLKDEMASTTQDAADAKTSGIELIIEGSLDVKMMKAPQQGPERG